MRVGVYVDAFNLYYGMKRQLGTASGWKWIDVRAWATRYALWDGCHIDRIVYGTARVNDPSDPKQTQRQDFYLRALLEHNSADVIEEGYYSSWAKESVLTTDPIGARVPQALEDSHRQLHWSQGLPVRRTNQGLMLSTIRKREEKGSDVNVATRLIVDVLEARVDAAIVISNDSDLALPIRVARNHVPTGVLNPSAKQLAGALKGNRDDGVGGHWWRRIAPADVQRSQLPDPVGANRRPPGW